MMLNSWKFLREANTARVLCHVAESYGITFEQCLENTQLTKQDLYQENFEIQERNELQIIRNILNLISDEHPIALEAGLRHHTTTLGAWGFAILSSANVREALLIAIRYLKLGAIFSDVALQEDGEFTHLNLFHHDLSADMQLFILERDIATIITLQNDILGAQLPFQIDLAMTKPCYANQIEGLTGYPIFYDKPQSRITIQSELLLTPLRQADDFTFMRYQKECEHVFRRRKSLGDYSKKIREFLLKNASQMPTIEDISKALAVNVRTIQRNLANEGITFHQLVKNLREDLADDLLLGTDLTIDQISERLGYAEVSVFSRAFKRCKGMPPAKYRKMMQQ